MELRLLEIDRIDEEHGFELHYGPPITAFVTFTRALIYFVRADTLG